MKYLMMCINESIRIYPPIVRYCVRVVNVRLVFLLAASQAIAADHVENNISQENNYCKRVTKISEVLGTEHSRLLDTNPASTIQMLLCSQ